MLHGKEVYRSIELNDNVKTASLSVMDQLRLIFAKLSNDDAAELDAREKLSNDKLKRIAALDDFIRKAIMHMKESRKTSLTVKLSSEFLPYLDEVLNDKDGYGRFYDIEVFRRDIPASVPHYFIVKMKVKESEQ